MRYILLVYDQDSNWMILRPIPDLVEKIIKNELLNLICIKGHHRFQGNYSIETAAGTLAHRAVMSLEIGNQSHQIFTLERQVYITMEILEQGNRNEVTDDANWVELLPYAMMYINSSSKNYKKSLRNAKTNQRNAASDQGTGDNVIDPLVDQQSTTHVSQALLPPSQSQPVLPLPDTTPFCQEQTSSQIDRCENSGLSSAWNDPFIEQKISGRSRRKTYHSSLTNGNRQCICADERNRITP